MKGSLLLVIPAVVLKDGDAIEIDRHFANNLQAYLGNFDQVTIACSPVVSRKNSSLPDTISIDEIAGHERTRIVLLPMGYREDRYLRNVRSVKALLRREIEKADYLLFSPHAAFDWPTLAAKVAMAMGRSYDMEADWDVENVSRAAWRTMPFGFNKLRKFISLKWHMRAYHACLKASGVALLQGQDVYSAYKGIAPNPQKVLNVQITEADYIDPAQLADKLRRIEGGAPLTITYAGRAIDMKGPFDWVRALHRAREQGAGFEATWFGEGILLKNLRHEVAALGLQDRVTFPGKVDREVAMRAMREADIFLFCHKTAESPRCLLEALASAAPLVGYGSLHARDLVQEAGGGEFVPVGDWQSLGALIEALHRDRARLAGLVRAAYASARLYDRDEAIQKRIDLIRKYVKPPVREVRQLEAVDG